MESKVHLHASLGVVTEPVINGQPRFKSIILLALSTLYFSFSAFGYRESGYGGGDDGNDEDPYEYIRREVKICTEVYKKAFSNVRSTIESDLQADIAKALCWNSSVRAQILNGLASHQMAQESQQRGGFEGGPIPLGLFGAYNNNKWKDTSIDLLRRVLYPKSKGALVSPKSEQDILAWMNDPDGGMWGGIIVFDLEDKVTLNWYEANKRQRPGTLYTDLLRRESDGFTIDSKYMIILKSYFGAQEVDSLMQTQLAQGSAKRHTVLATYFSVSVVEAKAPRPPTCDTLFNEMFPNGHE